MVIKTKKKAQEKKDVWEIKGVLNFLYLLFIFFDSSF